MGKLVTDMVEEKPAQLGVKKHTATIQSTNTLSLLQRKICNALLFHAYNNLLTRDEHEITVKELCRLISYNGNNQSVIKEALAELVSTRVEWNIIREDSNEEDWSASAVLADVNLKGSLCKYSYSNRMRQLLYNPSMFARLNLYIQSHFRSSYGLALYENCTRYENLTHTGWFDLETFRKLMGVTKDHYKIFRDFKKRVLDKAVQEVNTYSDLFIEPEFQKRGRTVVKLRFSIKFRNKKKRLGLSSNEPQKDDISVSPDLLTKLKVFFNDDSKSINKILENYTELYINEKISLIENSNNYIKGKVKNPAGLLVNALKKDFKDAKSNKTIKKTEQSQKRTTEAYSYPDYKNIYASFLLLPNLEQTSIIENFKKHIANTLYFSIFQRKGLDDILIKEQLAIYLNKYSNITFTKDPVELEN